LAVGDEVATTMHVNIPNVTPLMTRLKSVTVQLVGGASHTLFENYAVTAAGLANNLDHTSADDTADATTFRFTHIVLGMPTSDPVFTASGSVDQYTIFSIATVEYQTAGARRMADVTTVRAAPVKRALQNSTVDVVATSSIQVDASASNNNNNGSGAAAPKASNTTIIIIAVGAVVGAAFVVAGTVFLVKNRWMRSRVEASKDRARFYNAKPRQTVPGTASTVGTGVFLGDVQLSATPRSPAHVEESEPAAAESVKVARSKSGSRKGSSGTQKKLRATKSTGASEASTAVSARKAKKVSRKLRPVTTA